MNNNNTRIFFAFIASFITFAIARTNALLYCTPMDSMKDPETRELVK